MDTAVPTGWPAGSRTVSRAVNRLTPDVRKAAVKERAPSGTQTTYVSTSARVVTSPAATNGTCPAVPSVAPSWAGRDTNLRRAAVCRLSFPSRPSNRSGSRLPYSA